MFSEVKTKIEEDIYIRKGVRIDVTEEEMSQALEQIGRDLVYNYLLYKKDVTYEIFIDNLFIYLNLLKPHELQVNHNTHYNCNPKN